MKIMLLLVGLLAGFGIRQGNAQKLPEPSYTMKFIRAVHPDSADKHSVLVLLQITPTHPKDFKLILSMRVTYRVGDEALQMVDVGRQLEPKIRIAIYGGNVREQSAFVYSLLKDRIDFASAADSKILAFYFTNISEDPVSSMYMRYGLWESNNPNIRLEKDFEFSVK